MENTSQLDKEVFEWHNNVRTNPTCLVPHLEDMLTKFDGMILKREGGINLRTNEGAAVVQELIDFLKNAQPIKALTWDDRIARAASDHTNDIGPKGITGHDSTDGTSMSGRMERYGQWSITCGENLSFGQTTGMDVVCQLLIDDGVSSRGHRTNIFNKVFGVMGSNSGEHKQYKSMCCIDYAGGFAAAGEQSNAQADLDTFMKEKVEIDMPEGARGWSMSTSMQISGSTATKTVTYTVNMADGSTQEI